MFNDALMAANAGSFAEQVRPAVEDIQSAIEQMEADGQTDSEMYAAAMEMLNNPAALLGYSRRLTQAEGKGTVDPRILAIALLTNPDMEIQAESLSPGISRTGLPLHSSESD